MKRFVFIFIALVFYTFPVSISAQETREMEYEDGFWYYRIRDDKMYGYYGLALENGTTIIPLSRRYSEIDPYVINSEAVGFKVRNGFAAKETGWAGWCNSRGREIIPVSRHYSMIYPEENNGKIIGFKIIKSEEQYTFNGDVIWCNASGTEIIPASRHYSSISPIIENQTILGFEVQKGKYPNDLYGICSVDGREIVPCIYYYILKEDIKGTVIGWTGKTPDERRTLFDKNFRTIVPLSNNYYIPMMDNGRLWFLILSEDNKYEGIRATDGTEIIAPTYYSRVRVAFTQVGDFLITVKDPLVSILNSTGEEVFSLRLEGSITSSINYNNGKFWVTVYNQNTGTGIYDITGKRILSPKKYDGEIAYNDSKKSLVLISKDGTEKVLCSLSNFSSKQLETGTISIIYDPNKPKINLSGSGSNRGSTQSSQKAESSMNNYNASYPVTSPPIFLGGYPAGTPNESINTNTSTNIGTTIDNDSHYKLDTCQKCYGDGKCSQCLGRGHYSSFGLDVPCTICNQTGKCPNCNGSGQAYRLIH